MLYLDTLIKNKKVCLYTDRFYVKNDDEAWEYLLEFYDVIQEEIDEFFKYRIVKDYYDGLNLISNLKRPDENDEGSE